MMRCFETDLGICALERSERKADGELKAHVDVQLKQKLW